MKSAATKTQPAIGGLPDEAPRVFPFDNGSIGIICAGQGLHLRREQALALTRILYTLLLEDDK